MNGRCWSGGYTVRKLDVDGIITVTFVELTRISRRTLDPLSAGEVEKNLAPYSDTERHMLCALTENFERRTLRRCRSRGPAIWLTTRQ